MMFSIDQLNAWTLAGALLMAKSAIVVGLGAVAARLVSSSAARRVYVWRLTFAGLLLLPLAQAVLPQVDLALVGIDHEELNHVAGIGGVSTTIAGWFVAAWVLGAGLALFRLARDTRAARALANRATPVTDERMTRLARALARKAGVRNIELRATVELDAPALIGWRHPVVLLPHDAFEWTTLELRAVLCHELEHARARDWPVMLLERAIGALYWPNPLLLRAGVASSAAREGAADNAVLRAAVEPQVYARQLLRTAHHRTRPQVAMALAFAQHGVEARVRALFSATNTQSRLSPAMRLAIAALVFPVALGASSVQPWTCLPPHEPASALAD